MIGRPGKQPYKNVGPEIGAQKYRASYWIIEKKQDYAEEQQRDSVRNKVKDISMNKWPQKYAYQSMYCPGHNAKCTEWYA